MKTKIPLCHTVMKTGGKAMLQIPKNVMQIGEVNPHTKIYMEDYVHTFLERRKKTEEYLAFGKREEKSGVLYYLIYGVEKRTDWDRGSYPYFRKYERIGTIEGAAGRRLFKPVRGSGIPLDGYFIFYEQNEDMQSYMIVVRENEETAGSEEKEEVMEAVRAHREQRKKELETAEVRRDRGQKEETDSVQNKEAKTQQAEERAKYREKIVQSLQKKTKKSTAFTFGKKEKSAAFQKPARAPQRPKTHSWTIPDLCRAGSMLLLLLLVVMGLTSINQYPDMKAVTELFSDAAKAIRSRDDTVTVDAKHQENSLVVEEAAMEQEESAEVAEAVMDETDTGEKLVLAENGSGTIQWMIGQQETQSDVEKAVQQTDGGKREGDAQQKINDGIEETEKQTANVMEADAAEQPAGMEQESANTEQEAADTKQAGANIEQAAENGQQTGDSGKAGAQADETEKKGTDDVKSEAAAQAIARPVSYVVKKGDSLAGIARKFYGNTSMLKEICSVNHIEDPDQIHPGQNILLP